MCVVGIDVGGTKVAAALVDAGGRVLARRRVPTPPGAELVSCLAGLVAELAAEAPAPPRAVGLGLPSMIDAATRRVRHSVNIDLNEVDIADDLERLTGLRLALDNDANLATLAEARVGAAAGARDVVMLTVGTGIGGGIMIGGQLFRGAHGTGAELGHVPVQADGPRCQGGCPGRGCLETMASGTAIAREGRLAAGRDPSGRLATAGQPIDAHLVARLAGEGDPAALEVLVSAGRYLGVAIAGFANAFDPEVVVVGGGVAEIGDAVLAPARAEYAARALPPNSGVPILAAALGGEAGMLGAALLALETAP